MARISSLIATGFPAPVMTTSYALPALSDNLSDSYGGQAMNYARIFVGGLVGGVVFNVVSILINVLFLAPRYESLQGAGVLRAQARLPFMPLYVLILLGLGIVLVWLYASARTRLGPGPSTALLVGAAVGLIAAMPGNLAQYAWTYVGGYVSMWWSIEMLLGCALGTLAGAAVYKE